jgi:hypothetical protein
MYCWCLTGVPYFFTTYKLLYQINPNLVITTYIKLEKLLTITDADLTVVGGEIVFYGCCKAAKKGDYLNLYSIRSDY